MEKNCDPYYKHALITGGSSGIGRALAFKLFEEGTALTLVARDKDKLEQTKKDLKAAFPFHAQTITLVPLDVSCYEEVQKKLGDVINENTVFDLVITCAGIALPGYFDLIPVEEFEQTYKTNFMGTVHVLKVVIPHLRKQQNGHIVMVSSMAGLVGIYGYSSYAPTKFALNGLAQVLDQELDADHISVSIVFPLDVDTPQFHFEHTRKPKETLAIMESKKLYKPEEVASIIIKKIKNKTFQIVMGQDGFLVKYCYSFIQGVLRKAFKKKIKSDRD
jgi:3-dehydrosphinganine reductase